MNEVKSAGKQAIAPVSVQESPAEKATETVQTAKTSSSTAQQLSAEGKAAKTSESQIGGAAVRQLLNQELKISASADGGCNPSKPAELKPGLGSVLKSAAEEALRKAEVNQSPAGVPYRPEARVPDNTSIFTDGKIDSRKVLESLTQHDQNSQTSNDQERCGGTAAIASAINSGGEKGLLKLINSLEPKLPGEPPRELGEIEERIKNKTATHGDLGKLSEIIHTAFAAGHPEGGKGIPTGEMYELYTQAGMKPPSNDGAPDRIFQNGQSWPVNLDTDGDGMANHWVIAGKDQKGRTFIYDPESTPGKPQIHYGGSPEYERYIQQMKDTGSGFAPITKADADRALEELERDQWL